jgi:hypothetical protein
MAVNLSPYGGVGAQFLDNSGNVLTGGKIFTYAAGTTTNQATYTNATGAIPHSNPIILDAAGRVPGGEIWLTDSLQYKFVLTDSNDVLIATYDNIIGINSNFVNYSVQEEIQTATAGQTVFTLTTINYTPGTNSLSVFVDGVNQYDGVSYAYIETDSTTVTFTSGLHVGALVKFTTAVTLSSGVTTADLVTYDPPFTNSVPTTVEDKLAQTVSVKDFGATGDGVTDDTLAIQDAINYAQNNAGIVFMPTGLYKITSSLSIDGSKPLTLYGAGRSTFNGSILLELGTVIKLATQNTSVFNFTSGLAVKHFNNFAIQNVSGGSAEIAFGEPNGDSPYFAYFADLTIDGFEHAFKFARSLYLRFDRMVIRNCDYGIDCWQFTGTPPYVLNSNAADGYYNNIITVRDSQIINSIIGYRLVGACIDVRNCDASTYTTAGFVFGGDDFSNGTVSADQLYVEGGSGTSVVINRMSASIGTLFLGSAGDSIGVDVTSARVTIDNLNGYGHVNLGVQNTNSYVAILGGFNGSIAPKFQNSGTGVTREIRNEGVRQVTGTIADTQFVDVPTEGNDNRTYALDVFGSDNGVSNYAFRIIQRGGSTYLIGTKPANLTISTPFSVSGNRNVRITNTAGVAYSFTVFVNYAPSFYSVEL